MGVGVCGVINGRRPNYCNIYLYSLLCDCELAGQEGRKLFRLQRIWTREGEWCVVLYLIRIITTTKRTEAFELVYKTSREHCINFEHRLHTRGLKEKVAKDDEE